jgi:hypothetical protein
LAEYFPRLQLRRHLVAADSHKGLAGSGTLVDQLSNGCFAHPFVSPDQDGKVCLGQVDDFLVDPFHRGTATDELDSIGCQGFLAHFD